MTLILIFLGWFILSSLWGFLPLAEPLRQFSLVSPRRRKTTAFVSGLLAFLTGALLLLWLAGYSAGVIMLYDAHAAGGAAAQASSNLIPLANELALRQLLPGAGCLSGDATVCSLAAQALQRGNMVSMLPVISAAALVPALLAAFLCWKLSAASQASATT